jgi:gliding motility-associated-like protein
MHKKFLGLILGLLAMATAFGQQGFRFSCTKDTTVAACGQGCATLTAIIPDIHGQSDTYTINKIAGGTQGCFAPYVTPNNNLGSSTELTVDDSYGPVQPLGFIFTFFGSNYNYFVAGTNGVITFDQNLANLTNQQWSIGPDIPNNYYDAKRVIMGAYHDMQPWPATSPTEKIQYQVIGTSPHRKWILSFYKQPLYNCHSLIENTQQIVLYEGTGIVEIFIYDKQQCVGWNNGKAILGMQDATQGRGIYAPGRGASDPPWGSVGMNEMWRFVPNSGVSLLKRVELVERSTNTIIATVLPSAVTNLGNGTMQVSFPNICSPAGVTEYLVRPVYKQIDKQLIPTAEIFGADTIRVHRAAGILNVTSSSTPATCATGGTVTVNVSPAASYQYRIDGGAWQASNTFTNVAVGPHTVEAAETRGSCATAVTVTVDPTNPLQGNTVDGTTSCPGANDGVVQVNASTGTAPFQYKLGSGAYQLSNSFTGLAPGTYQFYIKDFNGCTSNAIPGTVTDGPAITGSATAAATSCQGAANGTISVNANGTGPFEYGLSPTGPWQTSSTLTGLAAGPYTVYIKKGATCVSSGIPVTVDAGPAITATYTATAASCQGAADGSATISPQAGTGPFEFRFGTTAAWQTSGTFSGLTAGTYNLYMRNAAGCVSAAVQAVVPPGAPLQVSATATSTSCSSANDGSITATNPNGTGPFEYSLGTSGIWQSSPTFTGLASGSYVVYTRNASCSSPTGFSITVNPGAALQATATPFATSCSGAIDGSVTVTNQNGTGPFEYRMGAAGVWQTSNSFTGLAPGTYDFYIRNASGCVSAAAQATINPGSVLQASATPAATSCLGATNGSVQVNALSGSGPYEYRMGATGVWQSSNSFTGLAAGSYVFYAKAASGCVSNAINVVVDNGAALTAQPTATATSCAGANDGVVTVTPPSGAGPFEYRMGAAGAWQTSNSFTSLPAGSYSFYVRNADCTSAGTTATVNPGPQLSANTSATSTSCSGSSDGSVVVSAANGTGPFEYSMNAAGPWQTSGTFNALAPGNYDFYVKNAAGCISPAKQATVTAGPVLQVSATPSPTSCSGATNGSVQVNALSGTGPYEYRMGATGSWQTANTFTALAPGTYTFYARSGSCVSNGVDATVNSGSVLTATYNKTDVSCFGGNDGTATINPPSAGSYTYSRDNFTTQQPGNQFTNLASGNYTFWLKDNAGCIGTVNVTITQPTQLSASTPVVAAPKCNGGNDGSITLTASGGTAPYQYALNGGSFGSSNNFNVAAGNHSVTIKDAKGCLLPVNNINVSQPAALSVNVLSTLNATCNGGQNGEIQLAASGGTSPFRYTVTGMAQQTSSIFKVNPGTYTVSVTDYNNCTYTSPTPVTIGLTNDLAYTPMNDTVICEGTTGKLQPQTNATQFVWKGPAITPNNATQSSINVKPVSDTFYTVIATYGRCSFNDTVAVNVNAAPVADAGPGNTICFGKSDTLSASGGVIYEWSPLTYLSGNITGPDPIVNAPQKTTTYTLYVRDAAGCRSLLPSTVTVNVTPPLLVIVNPIDTIGYFGDSIRIKANSIGTSYTWTPTVGLSNPNIQSPLVFVTTDRIYKVTATTAAGCSGEGLFKLRAYKGPDIYVPTAFTPNGDGLNDRVRPFSVGIEKLNYFRIFDRWGQLMYEYKGEKRGPVVYSMLESKIGWDGTFKGLELNTGTFVWLAEGVTKQGKIVFRKGSITLIR